MREDGGREGGRGRGREVEEEGGREVEQDKGVREGGNGTLEHVKLGALAISLHLLHTA